jgi:LmbE family N-acetylglucosaminyl deacetylase
MTRISAFVLLLAVESRAQPSGTRETLQKLETRASLLHVTAHPDDEHGGMLTLLSRGQGARVALVSLTRGEAGANAIGSELFDGLGWVRAEELAAAGRHYGLDALYFTRLADYGYSKRLSEAVEKWGREEALRDLVRIIRMERPLVVVSRFQGTERDGHGQHRFAGVLSREAFRAAGDGALFPEAGAPFQPLKLYIGGMREDEDWNVVVDSGIYDPWLGDSYENVARRGLSLQRSQTGGRVHPVEGPFRRYYKRVASLVDAPEKESSFFDGIETIVPGNAERERMASAMRVSEGIRFFATARPKGAADFATMGPVVPGDVFDLRLAFWNGSRSPVRLEAVDLHLAAGWKSPTEPFAPIDLAPNETWSRVVEVRLDEDAATWTPHIERDSIAENRYRGAEWYRGAPAPMASAEARYEVQGVDLSARDVVKRFEAQLPFGDVARELVALPALSVSVRPRLAILAPGTSPKRLEVSVEVRNHASRALTGRVTLELPDGLRSEPAFRDLDLKARQVNRFSFQVEAPSSVAADRRIRAIVTSAGRSYGEHYDPIEHRDLETRYLVTPAEIRLSAIDVQGASGLVVGYVEGVGDEVPEAIEALGATVERLSADDLATKPLEGYAAVVLGTRAYAVREDIVTHNGRLLSYVEKGGHLLVLYNTPEFHPEGIAPYPGTLPENAEEVSEEDSPVEILAPEHPVLRGPNGITLADFDSWLEQRGSKFWSEWDDAYVPILASHDEDQPPQRGGWLVARHGKGYYTYFAYALHRQLPLGVPGAYRLLANLLALGRTDLSSENR